MSETETPPAVAVAAAPPAPPAPVWHQLLEPQFLVSMALIALAYIIFISAIRFGSAELQAQVLSQGNNIVVGLMGFFFGAAVTKALSPAPGAPAKPTP